MCLKKDLDINKVLGHSGKKNGALNLHAVNHKLVEAAQTAKSRV